MAQALFVLNSSMGFPLKTKMLLQAQVDGASITEERFVPEAELAGIEPDVWGLFFTEPELSDEPDAEYPQPDLLRVLDTKLNTDSTGHLTQISEEDMQNTDVLIFRTSTGELVTERLGLRDEEIEGRRAAQYIEELEQFHFNIPFRGPYDSNLNIGGTGRNNFDTFADWSVANRMAEPFQERGTNTIRPSERLTVVAINRATDRDQIKRICRVFK